MKKILFFMSFLLTALAVHSQTNIVVKDKSDRNPILIEELKTPVTSVIAKDYPGFIINQATRVVKNNIITFEIIIIQGTTTDTLFYDQNFFLVRTIVHNDSIKPVKKINR